MATPYLVTGDDFIATGTAYAGDPMLPVDLSGATSVRVCVVSADHRHKLCNTVTLAGSEDGAAWERGRVSIDIPADITAAINVERETIAKVEIEAVIDDRSFSWFDFIMLVPGRIN